MSEETAEAPRKSLQEKLSEVMALVRHVPKRGWNDFHKYNYVLAEDVFEVVNKALSERQICVETRILELRLSDDYKNAAVKSQFIFRDGPEDCPHVVEGWGQGSDRADKAIMKAETAAMKYAYFGAFCISSGDDPERDTTVDKLAAAKDKAAKPGLATFELTAGQLAAAIEAVSGNKAALESLRPQIYAFKGKPEYDSLVAQFKASQPVTQGAQ